MEMLKVDRGKSGLVIHMVEFSVLTGADTH